MAHPVCMIARVCHSSSVKAYEIFQNDRILGNFYGVFLKAEGFLRKVLEILTD